MTIKYYGLRKNYNSHTGNTFCSATIFYDDENNFDCQIAEYVMKVLEIKGWTVSITASGWIDIKVSDREEYDNLLEVYKIAKRNARLNAKIFPNKSYLCYENI